MDSSQREGTQETGETAVDRQLKQTPPKNRNMLKQLAKKVAGKFKEVKEEKRRSRTEEADHTAETQVHWIYTSSWVRVKGMSVTHFICILLANS